MTYDKRFRLQVLKVKKDRQLSNKEVSELFGINERSIYRWQKEIEPKKHRNKPSTKIDMEVLSKDLESYPDSYNYERAKRLGVSTSGIRSAIKRLGITRKKNSQASENRRKGKG